MTRVKYYTLEGKEPKPIEDFIEWANQFGYMDRIVKQTQLPDNILVSTVFLGLDHSFGDSEPLLFETMIFGGEHDEYQERYSTWDEAEKGHQEAINMIYNVENQSK